jgi:hypothetical protein
MKRTLNDIMASELQLVYPLPESVIEPDFDDMEYSLLEYRHENEECAA